MAITEKYSDKIAGVINCYDRVNIKCRIGMFGYAGGMDAFFYSINRKHFDYCKVFEPITDQINKRVEGIAKENGLEIEFVRKVRRWAKRVEQH